MKKFITAIRKRDMNTVRELLEQNPSLANYVAKQPPKMDDGQSALQIAVKTRNFEAANLLMDYGADVNFMEAEGCCDDWRMPVLNIAVMYAVMCCRRTSCSEFGCETYSSEEEADAAFSVLRRVLALGADVHAKESFGTSCSRRLCKAAEEVLPAYSWGERKVLRTAKVTPELRRDLGRIFRLLKDSGADFTEEAAYYASAPEHPIHEFLETVK